MNKYVFLCLLIPIMGCKIITMNQMEQAHDAYMICLQQTPKHCQTQKADYEYKRMKFINTGSGMMGTGGGGGTDYSSPASLPPQPQTWMVNQGGNTMLCNNIGGTVNCN